MKPNKHFANSASLQTIVNRGATTTGPQASKAASMAEPTAWASTLDEMACNVKHAGNSDDQVCNTFVRTDAPTITIGREEIKSLVKTGAKLAVEATRREEMRGVIEDTVGDFFTAEYHAATDGIEVSSFLFN